MTDWQLERAAGEAIGLKLAGVESRDAFLWLDDLTCEPWVPLGNDCQAMQLVRKLHLHIDQRPGKQITVQDPEFKFLIEGDIALGAGALNRAIVKCAAVIGRARPVIATKEDRRATGIR
jgi:hypothetical protein